MWMLNSQLSLSSDPHHKTQAYTTKISQQTLICGLRIDIEVD